MENNKKNNRRLTDAQEAFVQGVLAGKSHYDAYVAAYPSAAKWKPQSVHSVAWNLLNTPHVKERYETLKQQYIDHLTEQSFYGRDQLLSDFMYLKDESKESIEQYGVRQANSNAYVSALKNIGEILDLYPDKKQKIKLDGDIRTTDMNPFENLTEEDLIKLIEDKYKDK